MAFEEDFTPFFDDTEFAVEASAFTRLGESSRFNVIFEAPHMSGLGSAGMETSQPKVLAPTQSVDRLTHGDSIVIWQQDFVIVGVEPDGTGLTRLVLELAS